MTHVDERHGPLQPALADDTSAPLHEYMVAKQAIVQLLRELGRLAEQAAPWVADRAHRLTVRLAEDCFHLVVVGQFKRGKTSLINAMIGRPLLPTGSIPVTSAVTSLRYGSSVRVTIQRAGQSFDQEIPLSALAEFITEGGNPGNNKHILSAEVEVPAMFLRRGLRFIDTPGIGSAQEQNTATTLGFLPEADAAIFVTGADAPLSETELAFLDTVRQHVRKLFFVLNKADQVAASDLAEVVAYTRRHLASRLGTETVRLFPVSAARAMADKAGRPAAERANGLQALEAALATFLSEDRQRAFLVAILDRIVPLLEETRFTITVRQRAVAASTGHEQTTTELNRRYQEQDARRQAIVDRAEHLAAQWLPQVFEPALDRFLLDTRQSLASQLTSASQSWSTDSVSRADGARVARRSARGLRKPVAPVDGGADQRLDTVRGGRRAERTPGVARRYVDDRRLGLRARPGRKSLG